MYTPSGYTISQDDLCRCAKRYDGEPPVRHCAKTAQVLLGECEVKSRFDVKLSQEKSSIGDPTISIPLDPQTAQANGAARAEEKLKIQALVNLWLRKLTAREIPALLQVLDEAGRKAQERGLTPEILDSLLKGA